MRARRFLIVMLLSSALAPAVGAQDSLIASAGGSGLGGGYGGRSYGGGNSSIGLSRSSALTVDQRLSELQSTMDQLIIQANGLDQEIKNTQKMIDVGKEPPAGTNLPNLKARAAQIAVQMSQVDREITRNLRLKAIAGSIDITLKSSPIRQAAEALSRASKLKITVDPKVPEDLKVNVEAQNVPLGAVLEVIADAAGLIIAPAEDGGLLLRKPGKLVVGVNVGQDRGTVRNTYTTDGDMAPWSDDWGIPGIYANNSVGRRWAGLFPIGPDGVPPPAPSRPAPVASPANGGGGGK